MSELTNRGEVKIVTMQGQVRMGEAVDNLRSAVDQHLAAGHARLVMNMEKLTTLDSSGIGVLVRSLTLAKQKGGTLKLAAAPPVAIQTLKVTGLLRLFEVFPTEAEAVKSFE